MELLFVRALPKTRVIFDAYVIEPVKKILRNDYICDNRFHLDSILEMYSAEKIISVVLISGSCSYFYKMIKTGEHIERVLLKKIDVELQKRQKKGGQSAPRIGRIRDEKENRYIKNVSDMILSIFLKESNAMIIAGPGEMKFKVADTDDFKKNFEHKLLKIINTKELNEITIFSIPFQEVEDEEFNRKITMVEKLIVDASDKLVFGNSIYEGLKNCALEYILIDSDTDPKIVENIRTLNTCKTEILIGSVLRKTHIPMIGVTWY